MLQHLSNQRRSVEVVWKEETALHLTGPVAMDICPSSELSIRLCDMGQHQHPPSSRR